MGRSNKKTEENNPSISQQNIEELKAAGIAVPGEEPTPEIKEEPVEETKEEPVETAPETKEEIPQNVLQLMKLYPQYEEIWVTPKGFVHHKNSPAYLTKGATLYKNKYYNK